jgi:hypothetical protein
MKNVVLYIYPDSALCARCKNGEMHIQQTDDTLCGNSEYEAICFINSSNNDGIACQDFIIDEYKKEQYSHLDDFDGCFDIPEIIDETE